MHVRVVVVQVTSVCTTLRSALHITATVDL